MPFKSATYTWYEGAFKGGQYKLTLMEDAVRWVGLEGGEKGQSGTETQTQTHHVNLAPGPYLISWLESVGYAVTVIFDPNNNQVTGVVSNEKGFYPLAGTLDALER